MVFYRKKKSHSEMHKTSIVNQMEEDVADNENPEGGALTLF